MTHSKEAKDKPKELKKEERDVPFANQLQFEMALENLRRKKEGEKEHGTR